MKRLIHLIIVLSGTIVTAQEKKDTVATKKINEIVLKKNKFQRKNDRFIYDVGASPAAKGTTVFSLLKETPLISSMDDKTLRIAGKSNAVIYINGKKNQMDADALAAFLKSMPSESIQKIEIITMPGSEFQVESSDGVINIILKKITENGLNGSLRMSNNQGYYNNPGMGFSINYRKNNLGINSSFNSSENTKRQYYILENGSNIASNRSEGTVSIPNKDYGGYLNIDYALNDKSSIALSYNNWYNKNFTSVTNLFNTVNVLNDTVWKTSYNRSINHENAQSYNNSVNLNYELKTDSIDSKLNLNAAYLNFRKKQNGLNTTSASDSNGNMGEDISQIIQETPQIINSFSVTVDYYKKFKNDFTLSFGGNYSYTKTDNDTETSLYQLATGVAVRNPNHFFYLENIYGGYLTVEKKVNDKISAKAGIRYELTQNKGNSYNAQDDNLKNLTRNYHNILPYLNLNYSINKDHNLSYSFSGRMKRPSFWEVNPVRTYLTETNYVQNNPFMKASAVYSQELNYMFKNSYFFIVGHKYYKDVILQIPLQGIIESNGSHVNVLRYIRTNFGNRQEFNFTIGFQKSFFKQYWNTNVSIGLQHNINDGSIDTDPLTGEKFPAYINSRKSNGITISTNNNIRLDQAKTWFASINYWYVGNYQIELGQLRPLGSLEIGLKKIWNDWTFAATVYDVLNTNRVIINDPQQNGNYNYINIYNYPRQLNISISYNFGNKKIEKIRDFNNASDEIKNRTK
ncbi:TonB-dependent receptor [Chryseobacterium sp. D764]|uniref:TonB-dependent receptor domain-containing protein n=1 Tax=Chryseobacterium sp. D764 TaxID=2856522 RepID=UPI001C56558D|nr:TonB-dependent receptor [Chryseobacterium sp. D764]QXU50246.1 TonB-dependent receptor [Chryseobacterium sp. D764]